MNEVSIFKDVGLAILGAAACAIPMIALGLPLLLGYLLAGVLLGPSMGLGLISGAQDIAVLSEIGLVLLMFLLGLEIDLSKLFQAGRAVIFNGVFQFIGCFGLGWIFFHSADFRNGAGGFELTYVVVASSLSSTLIVVKILSDRMEMDSLVSRITIGVLVFQDIWAILFLAVQPNLAQLSPYVVVVSLLNAGLLVVASWTLARFVLPRVFQKIAKYPEVVLLASIAWCFLMCGIAAYLKLSMEMGSLIAGVMIASLPYHLDIAAKVASLRDFFITLFFVSLGLQIPVPTREVLEIAGLVIAFVSFSRIVTMMPILYKLGYGIRASFLPALNLSQLSEFALVIGSLGVAYGHIRPTILAGFILALIVSALISSWAIPGSYQISGVLIRVLARFGIHDRLKSNQTDVSAPREYDLVLLGFFREASSLLWEYFERHSLEVNQRILVVDFNPEVHRKLEALGVHCKYGDVGSEELLRSLRLDRAKAVFSTIRDQNLKGTSNLKLLKQLKQLAPESKILVTSDSIENARVMYQQGADYVHLSRFISAHYMSDVIERTLRGDLQNLRYGAIEHLEKRHEIVD